MGKRALGTGIDWEVDKVSSIRELGNEGSFAQLFSDLAGRFSQDVRELFSQLVSHYAKEDGKLMNDIYEMVEDMTLCYGTPFVISFFILSPRWKDLDYFQLKQVIVAMEQEYSKKVGDHAEVQDCIKARQNSARVGSRLMRYILEYNIKGDERSEFLRETLVMQGIWKAELLCFLMKRPYFNRDFFREAVQIAFPHYLDLAHKFLDACESWELNSFEVTELSTNILFLLNKEGGEELCMRILNSLNKPEIFDEVPESYH